MDLLTIAIVFSLLIFFIGGNILIYKFIVNRALKKIIRPYLNSLGYEIEKVEFPGLLNTGDFKNSGFQIGRPVFKMGNPVLLTYVNLFLKPAGNKGNAISITAKIKTVFFFIRKVEYSKQLPNLIK